MVESRDAQGALPRSTGDTLSADALYRQGMEHYRRHQWREARESFLGLKQVDPAFGGIDALLAELGIFICLESFSGGEPLEDPLSLHSSPPVQAAPKATRGGRRRAAVARVPWMAPALLGALVLVSALYGAAAPQVERRIADLRGRGRAYTRAGEWSEAINAYEQLLLLAPGDLEARDGLAVAYYERADQRWTRAQGMEDLRLYGEAAQRWEMALADYRAAHEVDAGHSFAPRAEPMARIAEAAERRRSAWLFGQAQQLRGQRRWLEAVQSLEVLRHEAPGYREAEVRACLCETLLDAAAERLASAATAAQVREAVMLVEQAWQAAPSNALAQVALRQARAYLGAVLSREGQEWGTAIAALESLVREVPRYAGGRAREALCASYMQRASERLGAGELPAALGDYQAVSAFACSERARAEAAVKLIAAVLTPTATPPPTRTPTATPPPTPVPGPSPTSLQAQDPASPTLAGSPQAAPSD